MRFVLIALVGLTLPATAQDAKSLAAPSASDDLAMQQKADKASPIPTGALEVTASGTLEWLREDQQYVARQNAVARHNGTTLKGDVLTAHYQTPPDKTNGKATGNEITLITAEGNPVELIAPTAVAYGRHGTYDVAKHLVVLTGDNLKLVTTDEVVTARDSLEYYEDKDTGVAKGDAVLLRGPDKLSADVISATFVHQAKKGDKTATASTDADGNPVKSHSLEHLDAEGHVVLVTQTDTVTGDKASYNPNTDQAIVLGNVRITRENNQLDGSRAEVDMSTGISRLFAAPNQKVHGLFVPKKKEPGADKT